MFPRIPASGSNHLMFFFYYVFFSYVFFSYVFFSYVFFSAAFLSALRLQYSAKIRDIMSLISMSGFAFLAANILTAEPNSGLKFSRIQIRIIFSGMIA